jgi:hypothetical protein
VKQGKDVNTLRNYIDENISPELLREPPFVSIMLRALLRMINNRSTKPNQRAELIEQYSPIFREFLRTPKLHLECIIEIQQMGYDLRLPKGKVFTL